MEELLPPELASTTWASRNLIGCISKGSARMLTRGNSAGISLRDFRNLNSLGLLRRFLRRKPLTPLPAGVKAPAFVLRDLQGRGYSLTEALKTGPVLAAFFKVNCVTSQFTFPFLQRIYGSSGGANFTLWGISQNHPKDTHAFVERFGITFPVLIDGRGYPVSNGYGLANSPTLFLIASNGMIQVSCPGFSKVDLDAIASEAARSAGKPCQPLFSPDEVVPLLKPG